MLIRRERPGDAPDVHRLHLAAFGPVYPGGHPVEADLVDALRRTDAWIERLSLVATDGSGALLGHVCCTRAHLLPAELPVLGLGPIGVLPAYQRGGVGAALMHAVVAAAEALDEPLIALLGHPDYYPRFGFEPAAGFGITLSGATGPELMARGLATYTPDLRGELRYAAPFRDL